MPRTMHAVVARRPGVLEVLDVVVPRVEHG
jgi:hypothetical protein